MRKFPKIYSGIGQVSEPFKGVLLDAYGVFWGGNDFGIISGAKEMMSKMVAQGKIVGVLSNSTQLAAKEVNKLHKHGLILGQHFHFFITSGEVARDVFLNQTLPFKSPRGTFWLFGGIHPRFSSHEAIFQGTVYQETSDIENADFIYISIPHLRGEDQTDPELFRHPLAQLISKKIPMVCANPDRFAHEGNPPRAVVRQGSIAQMYQEMGGFVFYMGKPGDLAFKLAMKEFSKHGLINPQEILMVGDTPETDIRGARLIGMASALVTKTGITAERISHNGLESVLETLSAEDFPDYFIEGFQDDV